MRAKQLELSFLVRSGRGGARVGAGRKASPAQQRRTAHRARPVHRKAEPVHVTLRAFTRSLRCQQVVRTVLGALHASNAEHFRVVHYSVQANHLHLIVEATDKASLSSGVRGLMVRLARRVNRLLFRRGRFWADRWHGRALTNPRQVRNALVYVLQNHKKHGHAQAAGRIGLPGPTENTALDPLSSAPWFDGFAEPNTVTPRNVGPPCVLPPSSWLLRTGWRRHGLIHRAEGPSVSC